jgi:tetratricopeptide (TPR) repeat protein
LSGRLEEAAALCQRAMAKNPPASALNSARQLEWLIQAYRNPTAAAEKGESQLAEMFKRSPDSVPVEMAVAGVHVQKGRFDQARIVYERVLGQVPGYALAHRDLAILFAVQLKDDAKANDHASKARQALPGDPALSKVLGVLAYRRADYRYAAQLLQESAQALPNDGEIWFHLGQAQAQLKQTKQAKESLEKALALAPTASWATEAKAALGRLDGGG